MYISLTNITIVICWISLLSFWAIKLMGGNWFEIVVTNQNFIAFSNLCQSGWVKYLVSLITNYTLNYFYFGAICQKIVFKRVQGVIINLSLISIWAVVNFVPLEYAIITSNYAYIIFIVMGIVYNKGWKKCFGLLAVVFDFVFSTLSILIRNIELTIITEYLLLLILCIDIYIMAALYYLYSNLIKFKKEIKKC